jgi:hypothetical protein
VRPGPVDAPLDHILGQSRDFVREQHPHAGPRQPAIRTEQPGGERQAGNRP